MIMNEEEVLQSVVEYLDRRGVQIDTKRLKVEVLYAGTASMTIRVVGGPIEMFVINGPYR